MKDKGNGVHYPLCGVAHLCMNTNQEEKYNRHITHETKKYKNNSLHSFPDLAKVAEDG